MLGLRGFIITVALAWAVVCGNAPSIGAEIREERGISDGTYIIPNELGSYVLEPLLQKRQGALISVGTFRTLNAAGNGQFSDVIMLDYDRAVTEFNRANIELISASNNRFEYLAHLFMREPSRALIESAKAGAISDLEYIDTLLRQEALAPSARNNAQKAMFKVFPKGYPGQNENAHLNVLSGVIRSQAQREPQWAGTFLGETSKFTRLRELARAGRVVAVNGSLSGRIAFKSIAEELVANRVQVSVVDLSNAVAHILDTSGEAGIKALHRNLNVLPLTRDAIVLTTFDTHRQGGPANWGIERSAADSWLYVATSARAFLSSLKAGHYSSHLKYLNRHTDLYDVRIRDKFPPSLLVTRDVCRGALEKLLTER